MIELKLEVVEPLHLATSHTVSPIAHTLEYIPGTALRGALAIHYRNRTDLPSDFEHIFERLFLVDGVQYGPFYNVGNQYRSSPTAFVIPATAHTCKRFRGFKNGHGRHGITDMLFEFVKGKPDDHCCQPGCDASLVAESGYYAGQPGRESKFEPSKRFITQTALDSRRETAAPQQLYSQEVLEEGQQFAGTIMLTSKEDEKLLWEKQLKPGMEYRLGGARSRAKGLMKILTADILDNQNRLFPASRVLADWMKEFDQAAKEETSIQDQGTLFSLTLLSHAIVRDEFLRPVPQITPGEMARYVHPALENSTLIGAFCQTVTIDGWNAAHRMPRFTDVAITAGSAILFTSELPLDQLAQVLGPVEFRGIGERKQEGFGRVAIDHPFHFKRKGQL